MKKLLFAAAVLLAGLTSCQQKGYTITGTVDSTLNLDGNMVYIQLSQGNNLDSTTIRNGAFTFTGEHIDTAKLAYIVTASPEHNVVPIIFILEDGKISAKIGEYAAKGTPLNEENFKYSAKINELENSFKLKMEEIQADTARAAEETQAMLEKEYTAMLGEKSKITTELYQSHTNDALGARLLQNILYGEGSDSDAIAEARKKAGPIVLVHPNIVHLLAMIDNLADTQPGKMAKNFAGTDAEGNEVELFKYVGQGNYAVVDFWASWCGPCRREIPYIAEANAKFAEKGLQVVGIVVWDKMEDHLKAKEALNVVWPQIFDAKNVATDMYGIQGIPQVILFGPDGTIIERDIRGEKLIEKLSEIYNSNKK